jgi:type III secretion protein V
MQSLNRILAAIGKRQDVVFALFLILIVCMLILPLPTYLVDSLLAFSIGLSLLVLVAATYLRNVLELSTFPSIILISTIFRLALTVSTTRLILTTGEAGHIIEAFGRFLVAGNVVVGLVIFLIIAIVQFIVVTKGAERIAEVSARFTLDALPGKQLSIDAEMRNGTLTAEDAKTKRRVLEKESQFFGAMDGAMRFVKGDAIAGLIIIFVNLLGGLLIGMFQKGMTFSQAAVKFSILSIGDGLVSQIPAMFIAIAAGAVVTRVVNDDSRNLGADITNQLFAEPRALAIAGGAIALIGLLPGFPLSVFWGLALIMCGSAFIVFRNREKVSADKAESAKVAARNLAREAGETDELLPDATSGDLYAIILHPETRQMLAEQGLEALLREGAREARNEVGYNFPSFGFRSSHSFSKEAIRVEVGDVPVADFTVRMACGLPAAASGVLDANKVPYVTETAADGSTRLSVEPNTLPQLQKLGLLPRDPLQMVCDDILGVIRRNVAAGFGVTEAAKWLEELQPKLGRLVNDVQQVVPLLRVVDVGRKLLEEGHTLAQPRIILETLLRQAAEPDPERLMDAVRSALRQQIIHRLTGGAKIVPIIAIAPDVEQRLQNPQFGSMITPAERQEANRVIVEQINNLQARAALGGQNPIVAVTASAVPNVRSFLARRGVRLPTMALEDFDERIATTVIGVVSIANARSAA